MTKFNEVVAEVQKKYKIKSTGLAIMKMVELTKLQFEQ